MSAVGWIVIDRPAGGEWWAEHSGALWPTTAEAEDEAAECRADGPTGHEYVVARVVIEVEAP